MRNRSIALLSLLALLPVGACEDPLIVLGDQPGLMRIAAGEPNRRGATLDSLAQNSLLRGPRGLVVADDGTLYIADTDNARILEVSSASRIRLLSSADAGCGSVCLVAPDGLALDGDGGLWIADPGAARVFRVDLRTGAMEVRAGNGETGDASDGTPALTAALNLPTGIAATESGTVYFSERGGHRVRWIDGSGGLATVAGTGQAGFSGDNGDARSAELNSPAGLAAADGRLYIADRVNNRIRYVDLTTDVIRTVAGNGVAGYSATDTVAVAAALNTPEAIAITDDGGTLHIADTGNNRVRAVDIESGRIFNIAGTGRLTYTGELLQGAETSVNRPAGVAVGPAATLFIADTGHQLVWRTRVRF